MRNSTRTDPTPLPSDYASLVALLVPRAISDDAQYENTLEMIDRLMATPDHTDDQRDYLETLVQLVEAYESREHAIRTDDLSGLDALRHLTDEAGLSASDLARLLDLHASMGSKLLAGDRALTVRHIRVLADHFGVRPDLFVGA